MKFGKLAVSLTAAAVMGAFAPVYAQNTSTYTTSSSADELRNQGLNSDSTAAMRNTDDNAPPVVQQEQDEDRDQGAAQDNGASTGPSGIEQDQQQTLPSGTYRTRESGRQPAPY